MAAGEWDTVEAFFAEKLYAEKLPASDALVQTCKAHPFASVQHLVLSLSSAATTLKSEWADGPYCDLLGLLSLHEAIIGLAIDLAGLELTGRPAKTCADLLEFWKHSKDPLFKVS